MTLWDSYQLRAFGRKDVAPIIDTGDALLIVPRDQDQRVREVIEALEAAGADEVL